MALAAGFGEGRASWAGRGGGVAAARATGAAAGAGPGSGAGAGSAGAAATSAASAATGPRSPGTLGLITWPTCSEATQDVGGGGVASGARAGSAARPKSRNSAARPIPPARLATVKARIGGRSRRVRARPARFTGPSGIGRGRGIGGALWDKALPAGGWGSGARAGCGSNNWPAWASDLA